MLVAQSRINGMKMVGDEFRFAFGHFFDAHPLVPVMFLVEQYQAIMPHLRRINAPVLTSEISTLERQA